MVKFLFINLSIIISIFSCISLPPKALYKHYYNKNLGEFSGHAFFDIICCSSVNTGFFYAIREIGNIDLLGFGHDHENDYVTIYYDVIMSYAIKTGYGGYGPTKPRGAKVYDLTYNEVEGKIY